MPALDTRDIIIIALLVLVGMLALYILNDKLKGKRPPSSRPPSAPSAHQQPPPAPRYEEQYRADFQIQTHTVVDRPERMQPSHPLRKLTPREQEVASLAAQGKSNRQIGDLLGGMSVNTVQNHLRHVYDKLGVRSRAELAAWWAKHVDAGR